jgi:uncharacterized protein (DUF952 family)
VALVSPDIHFKNLTPPPFSIIIHYNPKIMSPPSPVPKYIYKILPSSPPPPSPLPHNLPLSALDARDNFIHLSTSHQILGTLNNFFTNEDYVFILRVEYATVGKWIKWEDSKGKNPEEKGGCWDVKGEKGVFPHIYANGEDGGLRLGREEVESVGKWTRKGGIWSGEGWPFGEEVPEE